MSDTEPSTGWIVRVASPPDEERFFIVAETNQYKALQIAKAKIPVREGDDLTLGMSVSEDELIGHGMSPGAVKQHEP